MQSGIGEDSVELAFKSKRLCVRGLEGEIWLRLGPCFRGGEE